MLTFYELNQHDDIVSVGGDWDTFAMENDGNAVLSDAVIGQRMWDFVDGVSTATYLHGLFSRCRHSGTPFETTYRCDSPDEARLFRMLLSSDGAKVRVESRLVWSKDISSTQKVVPLSEFRTVNRCSVCCAYRLGDTWFDPVLEPEEAYFPKSYELCDKCKAYADTYLRSKSTGTTPFTGR